MFSNDIHPHQVIPVNKHRDRNIQNYVLTYRPYHYSYILTNTKARELNLSYDQPLPADVQLKIINEVAHNMALDIIPKLTKQVEYKSDGSVEIKYAVKVLEDNVDIYKNKIVELQNRIDELEKLLK